MKKALSICLLTAFAISSSAIPISVFNAGFDLSPHDTNPVGWSTTEQDTGRIYVWNDSVSSGSRLAFKDAGETVISTIEQSLTDLYPSLTVEACGQWDIGFEYGWRTDTEGGDCEFSVSLIEVATGSALASTNIVVPASGAISNFDSPMGTAAISFNYNTNAVTDGSAVALRIERVDADDAATWASTSFIDDIVVDALDLSTTPPNGPPAWQQNPVLGADAAAGIAYVSTLAGLAIDYNGGATTYSLIDTGTWLNVATNGALSGTPSGTDTGTNSFTVAAHDDDGSATAVLNIYVAPIPPRPTLIVHYDCEESSSPLIDKEGGETAEEVDAGHLYSQSSAPGFETAAGLNSNGAWQLDPTESAELNNLQNDFTFAAWVYIDSSVEDAKTGTNADTHRIIGDDAAWDGDAWSFGLTATQFKFTKNGVVDIFQAVNLERDSWHHVAVTVSSTAGLSFYLDGNLVGSNGNTQDVITGDDPFAIGRSYGNAEEQWFPGMLDEIKVAATVLSPAQIAWLMVPATADPVTVSLAGPVSAGTELELSWINQVGATYSVVTNSNLITGDWQPYASGITGAGETIIINVPISDPQLFYKVISQ